MANKEHLAILRQGVEVWNQWREVNSRIRPDLSCGDFNDAVLNSVDLSNAYLVDSDFSGAHLSHTNLRNTNFSGANLIGANLTGADMSGVDLNDAFIYGAQLGDTLLINATLYRADISRANLIGADLTGADISGTNLSGVNLSHANLSGAFLDDALFANIDLRQVKGLELIRHNGPSTIGIDTIYKSKGQIPEIFLRGCGVPEVFIEYMHALTAKPFEFYSCFISYNHADAAFAQRLHDTLQGKGVRCWLDEKDAKLGVPITHNIESGIRLTDKFLLCCSKESLGSGWVNYEIDLALHRETDLRKQGGDVWRIIPLDLDGHLFSPEYSGEALRIRNRLAGDFTGWKTDSDKFDRQMARVMQAIRIEGGEK